MFKKEIRKKGTERNNKKSSFIDVSNMQISTPFLTLFLSLSPFICLGVKAKDVCDLVTIGLFVFNNIFIFIYDLLPFQNTHADRTNKLFRTNCK